MKIRKATKKDFEEIDKIYVEGSLYEGRLQFPKVSKKEMVKELNKARRDRLISFRRELKDKKHFWIVAIENNNIIGIGNAWIKSKDTGMIGQVFITKRFRGKGFGTAIMKNLIKWLKGKKKKYIESGIYWNNKPSIKFHEKLGFKPIVLKMKLK